MTLDWRVVPIQKWPGPQTKERRAHRFRRTRENQYGHTWQTTGVDWPATVALLERELGHLDAKNVLLQMAVAPAEIRNDGWIRANARPSHPGVILTFDSKYGPLSYPCDTYTDWQANIRAVAVSLEWLRGVDRHGVTRRGEQYAGWKALPPAGGTNRELVRCGQELIRKHGSLKRALFATHPDHGGDVEDFRAVQAARAEP